MATIAFLGMGLMGSQMANRLRVAGHDVRAWNRMHDKAVNWARAGGVACETARQAAEGATEVHAMLADDEAVEAAFLGESGALQSLKKGGLVVDHSTASVAGVQKRAAQITADGWRFLQAPMLAGPTAVSKGEGMMLIGGEHSAYQADEALLHSIVQRHWWVGEKPSDAAAFKLMANSMLVSIVESLVEYYAIGKANGIDPEHALTLFESFDPGAAIKLRGPTIARGEYQPAAFALSMVQKDVRLMLAAAGDRSHTPALAAIYEKMSDLAKRGLGNLDLAALGADVIEPSKKRS